MIFDNILFHNVESMELTDKGYLLCRVPETVREQLNDAAKTSACYGGTGVELRFKLKGDSATIILHTAKVSVAEAPVIYVYYGTFQGGWTCSSRALVQGENRIEIKKPENLEFLKQLAKEKNLPFNPEVVRVVLHYGRTYYVGVEGEVEVPAKDDMPQRTYLAYGSSITHGSLALGTTYTYPFRLSQKLGCDYINLGMAGSAHLETAVAEHIVSRKDWDFATVEMGINLLEKDIELFEQKVDCFTKILEKETRPIFATSIYGFSNPEGQENGRKFRAIVEKYAKERLEFIDGLKLLDNPAYISQDMVHPSIEGIAEITNNWYKVLSKINH